MALKAIQLMHGCPVILDSILHTRFKVFEVINNLSQAWDAIGHGGACEELDRQPATLTILINILQELHNHCLPSRGHQNHCLPSKG